MTVADYSKLLATETSFDKPVFTEEAADILGGINAALRSNTRGFRDAPRRVRRYPVVIYAPSSSAPSWENADLCEYLASYGYVVIGGPGASGGPGITDLTRANEQAKDISFLMLGLIHEEFSSLLQRDENVWKLFQENHKAASAYLHWPICVPSLGQR